MWIPTQYRIEDVATSDQELALVLSSGELLIMSFDFSRGRPWEDITSRSAPNSATEEHSPDVPEDNAAPAQMRQHHRAWHVLKQFLKSPAWHDGKR